MINQPIYLVVLLRIGDERKREKKTQINNWLNRNLWIFFFFERILYEKLSLNVFIAIIYLFNFAIFIKFTCKVFPKSMFSKIFELKGILYEFKKDKISEKCSKNVSNYDFNV